VTSSDIVEGLKTCELFTSLSEGQLQLLITSLATACQVEDYEAGDSIFVQGEYNANLYVIVDGQVLLQRSVNIGNRAAMWPLGLLGKGRAMGWSALLYGTRYLTVSAICQKPTRIVSLEGAALRSVLEKDPEIGLKVIDRLACMLGDRLRTAYNGMEAHL
jgi:CRP-like cAMP-binding protein